MKKALTLLTLISILLAQCPLYKTEAACLKCEYTEIIEERKEVTIEPIDVLNVGCSFIENLEDDNHVIEYEEPVEEIVELETTPIDIPTYTQSKPYEDGSLITDTTSEAYNILSQCYIDERGHYMYEDYYAVAMGNYFDDVGSKYIVTLDDGSQFKIIKCDVKQDQHTTNRMLDGSGAMIEFIINAYQASQHYGVGANGYILNGSFNNHEDFQGCIVGMEQIKE